MDNVIETNLVKNYRRELIYDHNGLCHWDLKYVCLLCASLYDNRYSQIEEMNATQHMLFKKDTNTQTISSLYVMHYDSSLNTMSTCDELYLLNKEQCEFTCESKHEKIGKGQEMILTKTTLKDKRLCCKINKK